MLEIRIKELEYERMQLLKRVKEQEVLIKKLEAEKESYQKCSYKLSEVTQTLPKLPLSSNNNEDEMDGEI